MARSVRSLRPRTCLLALAAVAALVALAGPLRADEHEATVTGTVTDAETGDPIEGATVAVGQFDQIYTDTSDSDGNYTVDGIEPGVYNVVADARRYALSTDRIQLEDAETREIDFALEPREEADHGMGYFEGNDEDMTEDFVGAACFEATHSIYTLQGEGDYYGVNDDGAVVYEAVVPDGDEVYDAGPLELEIEATETYYHGPEGTHGTDALDACTVEAGAPIPAEFRLFADGHVHDGDGGPCVGEGEFWRDGDPFEASWTLTSDCTVESDDDGVGQAPAGTEQILQGVHEPCFGPGAEYCPDNIRGDYGQSLAENELGRILGEVTDAETGEPIDGASVRVPGRQVTTDSSGAYEIDLLGSGTYDVTADAEGYASTTEEGVEVTAPETTTVDLALAEPGAIHGTVTDADSGDPVEGATVSAGGREATTDGDGGYTIGGLDPGTYAVTAEATGFEAATQEGVEVESGETATVDLALEPDVDAAQAAGTGRLEGNDNDMEEQFVDDFCFETTHSVYALRGDGTYHGSGGDVVYRAEVDGGQLHDAGPIQLEIEASQTFYHGPTGTHGTEGTCTEPVGTAVPAEFRLFAEDHLHDGDGEPCLGEGEFWRDGEDFGADWTLSADCTVEGNDAGTPGSGVAEAGGAHTLSGVHEPCFAPPCQDNIRVDYTQGEADPEATLDVSGPESAGVDEDVTITATLTDEGGTPVEGADVAFDADRIDGLSDASPEEGSGTTDGDGETTFTFSAGDGIYTVRGSATHDGRDLTGTHTVTIGEVEQFSVGRLSGPGRVDTALAVSQAAFDAAEQAVLARADAFPDALTAASLAAEVGGPILITQSDALHADVADELERLGVSDVYLAGGTGALSQQVADDVEALDIGTSRLDGSTRYQTAELVAREVASLGGAVDNVVVARDDDFPDALAAGNLATWDRAPILLTPSDTLHPAAESAMNDPQVVSVLEAYVVGGEAAIGSGTVDEVEALGYATQRLSGSERYATAAAIIAEALEATSAQASPLFVASGLNFPDALVAGPAAHASGGVLALVDRDDVANSAAIAELLEEHRNGIHLVQLVGGAAAIDDAVSGQIQELLRP